MSKFMHFLMSGAMLTVLASGFVACKSDEEKAEEKVEQMSEGVQEEAPEESYESSEDSSEGMDETSESDEAEH